MSIQKIVNYNKTIDIFTHCLTAKIILTARRLHLKLIAKKKFPKSTACIVHEINYHFVQLMHMKQHAVA